MIPFMMDGCFGDEMNAGERWTYNRKMSDVARRIGWLGGENLRISEILGVAVPNFLLASSTIHLPAMVSYYDELEIEDFAWDAVARVYHYPCPCGDRFEITKSQLRNGEEIATCPSCSLIVRVIYDYVSYKFRQR